MPSSEGLLKVSDAAQLLGVDQSTIYKWTDEGRIPHVDFGQGNKRCLRFKRKELDAFVERNSRGQIKKAGAVKISNRAPFIPGLVVGLEKERRW